MEQPAIVRTMAGFHVTASHQKLLKGFEGNNLLPQDKDILEKIRRRIPFRTAIAMYKRLFK